MLLKQIAVALFVLLFCVESFAGAALDRLDRFTQDLIGFTANYTQVVYDANSKPVQETSGKVSLQRPGLFRWTSLQPSPQTIVSDGEKLWVYDEDLAQVTVRAIDESLSSTPLLLLGNKESLDKQFKLSELGSSDGIDWLQMLPHKADAEFEKVFLGLNDQGLVAMELRDNFGQATQIRFEQFKMNPTIDPSVFKFTPPKGVDVIGQ